MIQQSYLSTQLPEIYPQLKDMHISGNTNIRKYEKAMRDILKRRPCDELFHYNMGFYNLSWPSFHRDKPRPTIYYHAGMIAGGTIPDDIMQKYSTHTIPFFLLFAEKKEIKDSLEKMLSDKYTSIALEKLRQVCTDEQFEYLKGHIYPSEPRYCGSTVSVNPRVKFTPELYKYVRDNDINITITGDYYATNMDDLRDMLDDPKNCYAFSHSFMYGNVVWKSHIIGGCNIREIIDFVLNYRDCEYFDSIAPCVSGEDLQYLYDNADKTNKKVVIYLLRLGYDEIDFSVLEYKDVEYMRYEIKKRIADSTDICDCKSRLCELCKLRTTEHKKKIWFGRTGKDCSICMWCNCIVITGNHMCKLKSWLW